MSANSNAPSNLATLPPDADPRETREWLESLEAVIQQAGTERALFLLEQINESRILHNKPK